MAEKTNSGNFNDHPELLRQSLRALEQMKQKLDQAESRARQPIAIIGMGCRFPGGADNAASFWDLLKHGREAISEVPPDRWNIDDYYDPDPSKPGTVVSRFGGFLNDIDLFDAAFFGIAPREAAIMDPQQRLLLEVVWEALEGVGLAPRSLAGSRTGMYLGIASGDYAQMQLHAGDASLLDVHYASGSAHSIASGRVSYLLGLKGPSVSVDTACSSSLVAVHLACQALRAGECTLAIAGGVNIILAPETTVALSQAHMLSPDGRSKAFDDRADGFARAEGCGVVILKPLDKAQADGDPILAVIRGTAVNQDGASSSLTAPNGPSQEDLMRRALEDAGKAAIEVNYVEAHGTGTSLGDPIELRALGSVYGATRKAGEPVFVGSLKTNLGHMEAAAGIGGLIKLVLALQKGQIPAHLQFQKPTCHVPWDQLGLAVPCATMSWPATLNLDGKPRPRVGAVSSFGFSGTNAHLIVEQPSVEPLALADTLPNAGPEGRSEQPRILPLSASSSEALHALIARYLQWFGSPQAENYEWNDIALTAARSRDHLRHRTALVAGGKDEAKKLLLQLSERGFSKAAPPSSLCFLFTGQGSERTGMGLDLLRNSAVFSAAVQRLESALDVRSKLNIPAIWANQHGELERASLLQPALYAYGWALSELWRSWGVLPDVVLGHSLGEYVAATVAGIMTPEEGIRLVAARGRLIEESGGPGGMVAIQATEKDIQDMLEASSSANKLSIAAVNGPASIVVSGGLCAIQEFGDSLRQRGLRHKRLHTTHGFHSAALDVVLDSFAGEAAKITFRTPQTRWISNLTGDEVDRKRPIDAQYWRQHLRHTVEFRRGLATVEADGPGVFLELGAEPQLLALCEANGISGERRIASISKSGLGGEWQKLLSAASQLYTLGFDLDWKGISEGRPFRRIPVPTYPFQRKRFWFSDHRPAATAKVRAVTSDRVPSAHPLLGARLRTHVEAITFHAELSVSSPAHFADHQVLGRPILPGAAYLEMALAAAQQISKGQQWTAVEVEFREACVFDVSRLLETVVSAPADSSGRRKFEIASCPLSSTQPTDATDGLWTLHAIGYLEPSRLTLSNDRPVDLNAVRNRARTVWDRDAFYARFKAVGLDFGLAFQPVVCGWENKGESLVAFELLSSVVDESNQYGIHPVALDACLQAAAALDQFNSSSAPALPAALSSFHLTGDPSALHFAYAKVRKRQGRALTVDITGLDADGNTLLFVEGLTLVAASGEPYRGWLHQLEWEQVDLPSEEKSNEVHAAVLPPISLDRDALRNELTASAQRHDLEAFDQWMVNFDNLCAAWIAQSFEQAGMVWTIGRQFQANDLVATLRVAPKHLRLARRFLEILSEFGYLETLGDDGFRVLPKTPLDVEAASSRLRSAHHPEMAWAERTYSKLVPLLRGEVSAVDVLFSEDGGRIATQLYRESLVAQTLHPTLVRAVVQAAEQRNGKARVLEVGGGTAATTSYLVPALTGKIADYLFTDLGAGFVSAARSEFGSVPSMRFQTLDLDRAPVEQGLGDELFDIIVASNVIHATRDLKQTMQHLRSVLAPGGLLLMAETVGKQPWIDLTVGFTEGWWRFVDHDLRPTYTLISKEAWISLLSQSDFGDVLLIPDQQQGILSRQCLIAAVHQPDSTPAGARDDSQRAKNQVLIVTAGDADDYFLLAQSLGDAARAHGAQVTLVAAEEVTAAAIESWFQVPAKGAAIPLEKRQIFYLPGAEVPSPDSFARGEDRLAWQQRILGGALALTQALVAADRLADCKLWLVSRGASGPTITAPDGASLAAFTRSLCSEYPNAQATAIDVESVENPGQRLWQISHHCPPNATQLALRADAIWAPRLVPYTLAPREADRNRLDTVGESETRRLHFPGSGLLADMNPSMDERRAPGRNEVEIAISAAAINFHEVLSTLQANSTHSVAPGGECAGVVVRVGEDVKDLQIGDAVVAIGSGLMSDFATLARNRVWKKPAQLSAEDAATLLIPFLTARWSLERIAKLKPGERVLIHAGAGGVGMAAIQEAKRLGAMVYATAGSKAKRALLRSQGVAEVFDSRSTAFESEVLRATGFHGVEVVLNSLSGDKIAAGLRCLAPRGRFIELGEHPGSTGEATAIRPDVLYQRVHLRAALDAATPEVREIIESVLRDAEDAKIQPLPWKRFDLADSAQAFRFMAAGQHTGRVLLAPSHKPTISLPIRHDGAYIVTGGLTGLGRLTVEWLASRGAGCILVLSRGKAGRDIETHFSRLENSHTTILTAPCDVSDSAALDEAVKTVPPIFVLRGIFHAAGVVDDASLSQQTPARFRAVLAAKVAGAWNLHCLAVSPDLDCFVLFSSAAGVFGARGQANHAAANAYLDALAHYRREQLGLVALSVNWGAWSGTGAAVRHNVLERSERLGIASISPSDGFHLLERLLEQDCTQILVSSVNWPKWAEHSKAEAAANRDLLMHLLHEPKTKSLASASLVTVAQSAGPALPQPFAQRSWRETLLSARDAEKQPLLENRVEDRIRAVLSLAGDQAIDSTRPLHEYGLDSLLSIELRNALSADLEAKLPATLLFDYPTLESLTSWLFHDVLKGHTRKHPPEIAPGRERGVLQGITSLSDDEVEKLFQQKMVGMTR